MNKIRKVLVFTSIAYLSLLSGCASNSPQKTKAHQKAEIYYTHGTDNLVHKRYTEALDHLLKAAKLDPKNSSIQNNLGMAYYFKGRPSEAIQHLNLALELEPKNSDAKNNLASVYYSLGKYGKAKKLYGTVKDDLVYRHQYRTYYNLALIALREGNKREAVKYLKLSIKDRPDYCSAHYKLGDISYKEGSYKRALDFLKEASMGTCYNYPAPIYYQGVVLTKLKKFQRARSKFSSVIEKFPKTRYATLAKRRLKRLSATSITKDETKSKAAAPLRKKKKTKYTDHDLENDIETFNSPNF